MNWLQIGTTSKVRMKVGGGNTSEQASIFRKVLSVFELLESILRTGV